MELVKIPLVLVMDHGGTPIRPREDVGTLSDFVVEFTYSYKEGEENDTAELKAVFDDIDTAKAFKFVPGIHYKIMYGYETGMSETRELVIDKVNKKAHGPGITVTLSLIPLADYEGRVLPMDHTTAKQRLALLIERDITINIKFPYDRREIILVNSDINSPSKKFDPLNDKYYSVKDIATTKPGIWDNIKDGLSNPDNNAHTLEPAAAWGHESYGKSKDGKLWNSLDLLSNILSWQQDMKAKLGMAEVHVRDGKIIIQDRDLEKAPIMSIAYGDQNLISWETEETDLDVQPESEYQAAIDAELKKQDIVRVSTLGAKELKIMHVGNTTKVTDENGKVSFVEDQTFQMKVFKHEENYYTLTDDFDFAKKVDPEMVPFIEEQINFGWVKTQLKERQTLLGYGNYVPNPTNDLSYKFNPITSSIGSVIGLDPQAVIPAPVIPLEGTTSNFTKTQMDTYEELLKQKYPFPEWQQTKLDVQQDNIQSQNQEVRNVSQMSLTEWAHANAQVSQNELGPWPEGEEPFLNNGEETYLDRQGYLDWLPSISQENKTLFREIVTHNQFYSDGYLRRRLANTLNTNSPLELRSLVDSFLNDTMEAELHKKKLKLSIEGNPQIEISQTIYFEGLDDYDKGTYYITESEHRINSSGYVTEIEALKVPPDLSYITEALELEFGDKIKKRKLKIFNKAYKAWKDEMGEGFNFAANLGYQGTKDEFTMREEYDHLPHAEFQTEVKETETTIIEVKSNPLDYTGGNYGSGMTYLGKDIENDYLVPGVKAALDTIAWAEGTCNIGTNNGYDVFFTGRTLGHYGFGYAWHPNKSHTIRFESGNELVSTACGRYQFLYKTWNELATLLMLPNFEPSNQDTAALALLTRRGVLKHFQNEDIQEALAVSSTYKGKVCSTLGLEWASFPNNPYGQSKRTKEQLITVYNSRLQHYKTIVNG